MLLSAQDGEQVGEAREDSEEGCEAGDRVASEGVVDHAFTQEGDGEDQPDQQDHAARDDGQDDVAGVGDAEVGTAAEQQYADHEAAREGGQHGVERLGYRGVLIHECEPFFSCG